MTAAETAIVNQLLGRLCYFHVLFIEPALSTPHALLDQQCCHHRGSAMAAVTAAESAALESSPWRVLAEIGGSIGVQQCRPDVSTCCAACRVRSYASAIADCWISTESRAYRHSRPKVTHRTQWCKVIAERMVTAFDRQYGTSCTAVVELPAERAMPDLSGLPLSGELSELWVAPIGAAPVASWLNHCAGIDDIAHELRVKGDMCAHNR
ncbi:hypothetical protein ACQPW1_22545 [Nocardia sp. CA-128927]|uniref:hypothetical protein n=1 Tax=Nocardia sp. CA-128927 TaxID=3239975 RepID=UPI003D982635